MIQERLDRQNSSESVYTDDFPVRIVNENGTSSYLLICEHASCFMPEKFAGLGLSPAALRAHIAWDPGAIEVARYLSEALDATLVEAKLSRLLIDCNRPLTAPDLIPEISELTPVPGNVDLSDEQRQERIELSYNPFHLAVEQQLEKRKARGQDSWVVTVHSYTPVYKNVSRPWQVGIIHDDDVRLAAPLINELQNNTTLNIGINEPYSPADRVYFTLERHARAHGHACAMIEIRNDEISDADGQKKWGKILADCLSKLVPTDCTGRDCPDA